MSTSDSRTPNYNLFDVSVFGQKIITEVEKAVIGKTEVLKMILAGVMASGGHILLEDYPGLAKTLIANSFATALGIKFKRIQFTPDLLPGDITGGYVYQRASNTFELRPGPLFANIILADEINRASPKTQSALLEAMQEYQITIEGQTMHLSDPFVVIATQNPIEYEGTFPLPEAQLDRFIMKLSVGYPDENDERAILSSRKTRQKDAFDLSAIVDADGVMAMRNVVEAVTVHADIEKYIVDIVRATRVHRHVAVGASPRGGLALLKLTRAWAALEGRDYILPDDVKMFAQPALAHRLIMEPDMWAERKASSDVIAEIIRMIPVPVLKGA